MKRAILFAMIGILPLVAFAEGVSIKLKNDSKWEIHHLFLSPVSENDWGPDQLGEGDEDTLDPKGTMELTDIPKGKYDVKLVDEDGDECVVESVDFDADKEVTVNDKDLLDCQADTEEEGKS